MVFRIHAVTIELGILCHFFVFFQHLRCVATRTIIDLVLIIKTASVVILLPVIVVVITPAATIIIILLLPVVGIHQG